MNAILRPFALLLIFALPLAGQAADQTPLNEAGKKIEKSYTDQLEMLRAELAEKIPQKDQAKGETLNQFLASDALDAQLVKFVILHEGTPRGLAEFAQQGREHWGLIEKLLADPNLMRQMLVADGAKAPRVGRNGFGPARYGEAMKIYTDIQKASEKASTGVLQRPALAISLEHAVPVAQANPVAASNAPPKNAFS